MYSLRGLPGDDELKNSIRAMSSFTRHHVNVMMTKSKTSGNYVNSVLAKAEVKKGGYDEAIMLDSEGYVSEASGENIFIVRNGKIKTTPLTSILPGITRDPIITLARDKGFEVVEGVLPGTNHRRRAFSPARRGLADPRSGRPPDR
jgi:branched-chain amino acid aminotransferase